MKNFNSFTNHLFEAEMIEMPGGIDSITYKNRLSDEEYEKVLGRKGELSTYLDKHDRLFTFGMLKGIFDDAITYKKRREMVKGGYKLIHRAVPMILAYVYFPIWILGNVLGFSRALNKILKPLLKNPENSYNKFLIKFIQGTISITEGEIKYVIGNDWFYDAFVMDDKLIKMVKKEVIRDFAIDLAEIMEKEDDDKKVPENYIENELKKYLNKRFEITPEMGLK